MIGLLVLAIMAWNFYIGYRRGFFMQAYYVVSVIIAMLKVLNMPHKVPVVPDVPLQP